MVNKKQKILLFFLVVFLLYCSISIGQSWDEPHHLIQGKITLNYLFSLGKIDIDLFRREYYSAIYWSLNFLLTQIFPKSYQIESSHLINMIFSLSTIFAIQKVSKELFNKKVGKIIFLILLFYPIFFGHMSINPKNTIVAFSHVWIFYLILKYLKNQHITDKVNNYIIFIGILLALATGINLFFLSTLIPILFFVFIDIFLIKKIISKKFNKIKFFKDICKIISIYYFLLIIFWVDAHPNILTLPFSFFLDLAAGDLWRGFPYNLVNGQYYLSTEVPKLYFFINLIYKSPEYFILCYIIFLIISITSSNFLKKKFYHFNYKLSLITAILAFPILIGFIIPYPLYDGMRLFLWSLPYFCIIPALTIYYLIENIKFRKSKFTFIFLSIFIIYFIFNFLVITPYQYTYLNFLNGKIENRYKKFENDYWGTSIKELINNSNFEKDKLLTFSTCGINPKIAKKYLRKNGYLNFQFKSYNESDYIIMTNRVTTLDDNSSDSNKLTNCFDKYTGKNISKVKRNRLILSVIRKSGYK